VAEGVRRDEEFSGTKPVEERHRIDEARLDGWMRENVEGYQGPLIVLQFRGGQSNPTYRLDTPGRSYVMRRKPFGKLLPSAHAVEREFRLLAGIHPTGFPVPRPIAVCNDESVIGAVFYLMEMMEGRIFSDGTLGEVPRIERRAHYEAMIDTLAALHALDPGAAGLTEFVRPGNYIQRQVERWTKQYRASQTDELPEVEKLIEWLPRTLPEQSRASIVHGDYRIDNLIYAVDAPRVLAVLDWELATIGDPLADFTYFAMSWVMPRDGRSGLVGVDLAEAGIPTLQEVVGHYCEATGRERVENLHWYFAYNLFRVACILQGIKKRIIDGTASSSQAAATVQNIAPLAKAAWSQALAAGETYGSV
jgi:aminoglycoside phosphotransferase (APT) family kinase protein